MTVVGRARKGSKRKIHGLSVGETAKVYRCCINALERCHDEKHYAFKNYGGRGVAVAEEWRDLESFIVGVINEIGLPLSGQSLDRIDNGFGYAPGNIRWANHVTQNRNRRNVKIFDDGTTIPEIAERLGCTPEAIHYRVKCGWSIQKIIETPLRNYPRKTKEVVA